MDYSSNSFENFKGLIVFYLSDILFCTDIDDVFAIVNPADFPKNVKNSFLVKRNLDLEGLTIPILELHHLFELKNGKITPISRFICIEKLGFAFAILADKVEEMITLDTNNRKEFELIRTEGEKYLTGKIKYRDAMFLLPNFKNITHQLLIHNNFKKEAGSMNHYSNNPP